MIIGLIKHALSITYFVYVMMIVVEYFNGISQGKWEVFMCRQRGWKQYLWAGLLGVAPGCLGAFAAVTLYSHRLFSLGAIVTTMIATSGDESFVMFALFPGKAMLLTVILLLFGMFAGWFVDKLFNRKEKRSVDSCENMILHQHDVESMKPSWTMIQSNMKNINFNRALILGGLGLFVLFLSLGEIGPHIWNWKRITFVIVGLVGIWIAISAPNHFLQEHVWRHVTKDHLPPLFLWTLGALSVIHYSEQYLDLESIVSNNPNLTLWMSGLVGLIPESGPHLFFVTLYDKGIAPFAVLVASSIVQDGHGMLPLLAFSRSDFIKVKGLNLIFGLAFGSLLLFLMR